MEYTTDEYFRIINLIKDMSYNEDIAISSNSNLIMWDTMYVLEIYYLNDNTFDIFLWENKKNHNTFHYKSDNINYLSSLMDKHYTEYKIIKALIDKRFNKIRRYYEEMFNDVD